MRNPSSAPAHNDLELHVAAKLEAVVAQVAPEVELAVLLGLEGVGALAAGRQQLGALGGAVACSRRVG
jgi:hypothetical protein